MRLSKSKRSPWGKQVYFEDNEFEVMMDCLRGQAGDCFREGCGVDIDLVLLKSLKVEPDFIHLPEGLLGRTKFYPDGSAVVEVSLELAEAAEADIVSRRRLRTTLAHEAGHICCHRDLFIRDVATLSLFDKPEEQVQNSTILCREEVIGSRHYNGEWWEYQANRCMAALLLPKEILKVQVAAVLEVNRLSDLEAAIKNGRAVSAIRDLADVFDVSVEATIYRLKDFGYIPDEFQIGLELV
ncbi:MAG: ImmA/IrrE family metallo-endopeptidase [candidate division Zixibacteria bacterium]|nr:ImmA/IrrE family metallo-endopeptidase [candidate division Zixibacteria bacterium]